MFKIAGITVFLHFSWFFVAIYQITRPNAYHLSDFAVYEYVGLFALVLMHEFGHAPLAGVWAGTRSRSFFGRWAALPSLVRRRVPGRCSGVLPRGHW